MWRRGTYAWRPARSLPGGGGVRRSVGRGYRDRHRGGTSAEGLRPVLHDQAGRKRPRLATSYAILRKHDGIITVRSKLGAGAVFRVYLPASPGKVAEKRPEAGSGSVGKGKILVMDDEDSIREVATAMLRALGYTAAAAKDGAEALKVYEEGMRTGDPFDAVIMDLTVPGGMGGREATEKLLRIDRRPG